MSVVCTLLVIIMTFNLYYKYSYDIIVYIIDNTVVCRNMS